LKAYNKHIAIFLLAIISAFIVPKELVHAFYEHNDTIHSIHHSENGLPVIENEHQHCEILSFNVPLYFLSLNFFKASEKPAIVYFSDKKESLFVDSHLRLSSVRGPPSVC